MTVLKQYAFKSPVYLELVVYELDDYPNGITAFLDKDPFIGNLRLFEVLETVRVGSILLFKEPNDSKTEEYPFERGSKPNPFIFHNLVEDRPVQIKRLINFLPASAKTLEVVGQLELGMVIDMFAGLPELKEKRLPNFQILSLEANEDLDKEAEKLCKKAGI